MQDLISRQAEIDVSEAQECQRAAQKRRYTFGNDEFSLEAAYHDCKLVFDGITDDDSFQEADTGLILYYANEVIYALHEALKSKGTNVHSNDYISRQAAIEALDRIFDNVPMELTTEILRLRRDLRGLPSADVVPVVRCRNCARLNRNGYCTRFQNNISGIATSWFMPDDDDFCSYGERKE